MNVERLAGVARDVVDAGHEIGNHSYSHAALWLRSQKFIADEVARAQQAIESKTRKRPTLFRAPYGVRWWGLRSVQREYSLLGVMWSVIANDWTRPAGAVAERVLRGAENGAVFCLHDGRELRADPDISNTIEAVERIVPMLRDRGFAFRTVTDLLQGDPVD
jgi:peptidoglycan/xylan/chitin deacetylase (PgdA/CDA1 family)